MFESGQRSVHQEIIPAKDRVAEYKRKSFGRLFSSKAEHRPLSGFTSQGLGDISTQMQSNFEEEERSVYSHPFNKFYSTGEPVVFKT